MQVILSLCHAGRRIGTFAVFALVLSRIAGAQITQLQWNGAPTLLNPSLTGEYYEYAPAAMIDPIDSSQTDIWSCHNTTAGVISDHIFYSKATPSGVVSESAVMGPSSSGWDSLNTCDPSVVQSSVSYQGTPYQYVLFYTGNSCGSQGNQIGMAFASAIDGTWTKIGASPIISYSAPGQCSLSGDWGVGQPSVTSIDGAGKFLVFYTVGTGEAATVAGNTTVQAGCYAYVSEVDYNSSSNTAAIAWTGALPTAGLPSTSCGLHNYDVMYDPTTDSFYAVGQDAATPPYYPQFISDHVNVFTIPGGSVWGLSGTWSSLGSLASGTTSFARNHDVGFLRSSFGDMPNPSQVTVIGTNGCASTSTDPNGPSSGPCNNNFSDPQSWLASYHLFSITGTQATGAAVGAFTLGSSPNSQTIQAGSPATYTIAVYPMGGFASPVNLTATGLPSNATVTFLPASVTPGSGPVNATLTIQLPQAASAPARRSIFPLAPVIISALMLPLLRRRRSFGRPLQMLCLVCIMGAATMLSSCSGSSNPPGLTQTSSTSQPTDYTIYVTGTSGSLQQTTTLSLSVVQ
jgi:hypothetical protein